jgi:hypothetical protein
MRVPEVAKLRFLTEICGLRPTVETYIARKGPRGASVVNASAIRSSIAATHHAVSLAVRLTSQRNAPPHKSNFSGAVEGNSQLPGIRKMERG